MTFDEQTRRVAERYSRDADAFAQHWAPYLRRRSLVLLERMPLASARVVLDLGTGTGGLLAALRAAAPSATVVGTDLSEGMLAAARQAADGPLALMDVRRLGLRDQCADAAILAFVLHRLAEPSRALAESARVLRPGGTLGTVTWGHGQRSAAGVVWSDVLAAHGASSGDVEINNHDQVDEPAKVRALLLQAGMGWAQCWRGRFEERRDLDGWIDFAIGARMGGGLGTLESEARAACLAEARRRIGALPPEALVIRSEVVYGLAVRPTV
jgi:SAM-dependent methyltransferase